MRKKSPFLRRHAGLTLVELLTVIAIIGILAAILIPVGARMRAAADQTTCTSNLRQWGVALRLHLAESRDRMPYEGSEDERTWGHVSGQTEAQSWYNVLPPYVDATPLNELAARGRSFSAADKTAVFRSQNRIFQERADQRDAIRRGTTDTYLAPSYMMNSQFYNSDMPNQRDPSGNIRPLYAHEFTPSHSSIAFMTDAGVAGANSAAGGGGRGARRPAGGRPPGGGPPLVGDGGRGGGEGRHADSVDCRHMGGANIVFLDGSVRRFTENEIRDPQYRTQNYNRPGLIWNVWIAAN